MLRIGLKTIRTAIGSRAFANAPAQEQAISTTFKVQDPKDFNNRVKNSKVPVIVDFFATYVYTLIDKSNDHFKCIMNNLSSRWCNPCRMLTPRIESVIAEKQGKVLLAKVDIDENSDLALDYEVIFYF